MNDFSETAYRSYEEPVIRNELYEFDAPRYFDFESLQRDIELHGHQFAYNETPRYYELRSDLTNVSVNH